MNRFLMAGGLVLVFLVGAFGSLMLLNVTKSKPAVEKLVTFGPDEHGVICYKSYGGDGRTLSCIRPDQESME